MSDKFVLGFGRRLRMKSLDRRFSFPDQAGAQAASAAAVQEASAQGAVERLSQCATSLLRRDHLPFAKHFSFPRFTSSHPGPSKSQRRLQLSRRSPLAWTVIERGSKGHSLGVPQEAHASTPFAPGVVSGLPCENVAQSLLRRKSVGDFSESSAFSKTSEQVSHLSCSVTKRSCADLSHAFMSQVIAP